MLNAATVLLALLAPPPLELGRLLEDVAAHAPAVDVAEARLDVAAAGVPAAGAWDDTTFSVMSAGVPITGGHRDEPVMIGYSIAQPLKLFGRRDAAKRSARARVARERAGVRRVAWDTRAQAVELFYELWMNDEMERILVEQLALLERMRETGLARVRAGLDLGHHDVLRAESELARMAAERASLVDERAAIVRMLNTLRGQAGDAALGEPVLPTAGPLPPLDTATALAARTPEVEAARAMQAEADAELFLARRMSWPMIMVEAQYQQNTGGMADSIGVGVSLSLPLVWRERPRAEVAMARAMSRAASREATAMREMASAELGMAWSRARAAERKLEALEQTAIPRLRETIASTEAAYVAGRGEFLALLDAIMQLQSLETERIEAVARRGVARFELERIAAAGLQGMR